MSGTIFHNAYWIPEVQPDTLRSHYSRILEEAGFRIVGFNDHVFEPVGYTAVWLLAESHLALHTFPEDGRTYVELTSCNQEKLQSFLRMDFFTQTPTAQLNER